MLVGVGCARGRRGGGAAGLDRRGGRRDPVARSRRRDRLGRGIRLGLLVELVVDDRRRPAARRGQRRRIGEDRLAPRRGGGAVLRLPGVRLAGLREGAPGGEGGRVAGVGGRVGVDAALAPGRELAGEGGAAADGEMREGAEGGEAEARPVVVVGGARRTRAGPVVVAARRRGEGLGLGVLALLLDQAEPAGPRQADHRDAGEHEAREGAEGAGDRPGGAEQRVARDAAEAGGQRPAGRGRQRARDAARGAEAQDPERQPELEARQAVGAQEPHPPDRRRQRQRQGAEPEELHPEVRDDRPPGAEQIAGRRLRGVVEARVLDGPGRQRDREPRRAEQEREARDLRHAPLQEGAERVYEGIVGRCRATKRTHAWASRVRGTEDESLRRTQLMPV